MFLWMAQEATDRIRRVIRVHVSQCLLLHETLLRRKRKMVQFLPVFYFAWIRTTLLLSGNSVTSKETTSMILFQGNNEH